MPKQQPVRIIDNRRAVTRTQVLQLVGGGSGQYVLLSDYDDADVLAKLLNVDGSGSGLDADLLDGAHGAAYALLAGRSGGQTLWGGTGASETLVLRSTAHATKGAVVLADQGGQVGIRTTPASGIAVDIACDATYSTAVSLTNTQTATSGNRWGVAAITYADAAATSSAGFYSGRFQTRTATGNGQNYTGSLRGARNGVQHQGSGTVTNAMGGTYEILNISTGTITNAYALYVDNATNSGGGAITNQYGIYVVGQTRGGTLNYAIYTGSGLVRLGDQLILANGNICPASDGTTALKLANAAGTAIVTIDTTNSRLVMADGANIQVGTTTGTVIGVTTAAKLAFFGGTPTTQATALTTQLTTITHTAPGTPDYAIQDLTNSSGYGFATKDEGNSVLKVIANLQTRVAELETKLKAYGLLA